MHSLGLILLTDNGSSYDDRLLYSRYVIFITCIATSTSDDIFTLLQNELPGISKQEETIELLFFGAVSRNVIKMKHMGFSIDFWRYGRNCFPWGKDKNRLLNLENQLPGVTV